jgi:hypothetical protein
VFRKLNTFTVLVVRLLPTPRLAVTPGDDFAQLREQLWAELEQALRAAADHLEAATPPQAAGQARAVGDLLAAAGEAMPGPLREEIAAAAAEFERAATVPQVRPAAAAPVFGLAAAQLTQAAAAAGRGRDTAAVIGILTGLVLLVEASRRQHAAAGRAAHARAAGRAARRLRLAAARAKGAATAGVPVREQTRLPATEERPAVTLVRDVLPQADADRVINEPAWPALARTLRRLEADGEDAAAALHRAYAGREIDTAEDAAAVLHARIRGTQVKKPTTPTTPGRGRAPTTRRPTPPPPARRPHRPPDEPGRANRPRR